MTFNVEDGTGVSGANAYVTVAEVTDYLKDRNRSTENSWSTTPASAKQAAIIAATDYIETRWSARFLGSKEHWDISRARATLTLAALPLDASQVVIGGTTYTFNTTLGGANSVLIGMSVEASIDNLVGAVLATASKAGVTHGVGTAANDSATAAAGPGDTLVAEADAKGTPGNDVSVNTTVADAAWSSATLVGGGDIPVPQPLSFPRLNLLDRDGVVVHGIPPKLRQATYEYAVRALASTLLPDPAIDDTGRAVVEKEEQVGPIKERTRYEDHGSITQLLRPYPAADRLLSEYILSGGRVYRG